VTIAVDNCPILSNVYEEIGKTIRNNRRKIYLQSIPECPIMGTADNACPF
jgi:hypothetical protein